MATTRTRPSSRGGGRGHCTIRDLPFSELVEADAELAEARREYASRRPEERRAAADFAYHQAAAEELMAPLLGHDEDDSDPWHGELLALAIDPAFAPAVLTVGTLEYELGRRDQALALLHTLIGLPEETEDLPILIDKAATYLVDKGDSSAALVVYSAAADAYPGVAVHLQGVNWCLGKLGRFEEAIEPIQEAVALEPDNAELVTDLGWSLCEADRLEEAERVLERAVALAPVGYDLAKANLDEVRRLRRLAGAGGGQRED